MANWSLAANGNRIFTIDPFKITMNQRVLKVSYQPDYKLRIIFSDGDTKMFDLRPYLDYPIYQSLKDESFCSKAKVFNGTVVWNEEIDFDPDTLYLEGVSLLVTK